MVMLCGLGFLGMERPGYVDKFALGRGATAFGSKPTRITTKDGDGDGGVDLVDELDTWFDTCRHVYLDFGTNIGVQIRKVYEPEKYPQAPSLPLFDKWFGSAEQRRAPGAVCSLGFEPNPDHADRLNALERCYNAMGWKVKILRHAVSNKDGDLIQFYVHNDTSAWASHAAVQGSTFLRFAKNSKEGRYVNVSTVDAFRVIMSAARRRAASTITTGPPPFVGAKFDVEGAEYRVLTSLLFRGALCHLNEATVEWHDRFLPNTRVTARA